MESTVLGVVLDSSVLIAAERAKLMTPEVINTIWFSIGDLPIVISALTVAELGHGIYQLPFRNVWPLMRVTSVSSGRLMH